MKGKIKSVPATQSVEGMLYVEGFRKVKIWHVGEQTHNTMPMKVLVVEYTDKEEYGDAVYDVIKTRPLMDSQWKNALDRGLVDSDKQVEFSIKNISEGKDAPEIAKIVFEENWDDIIHQAVMDFATEQDEYYVSVKWLKENYNPPKRLKNS